jgi:hypothetical protein
MPAAGRPKWRARDIRAEIAGRPARSRAVLAHRQMTALNGARIAELEQWTAAMRRVLCGTYAAADAPVPSCLSLQPGLHLVRDGTGGR